MKFGLKWQITAWADESRLNTLWASREAPPPWNRRKRHGIRFIYAGNSPNTAVKSERSTPGKEAGFCSPASKSLKTPETLKKNSLNLFFIILSENH